MFFKRKQRGEEFKTEIINSRIHELEAIAALRIIVDTPFGEILNLSAEHAYLISHYMDENSQYMQLNGSLTIKFERASLPSESTITTSDTERPQ